MTTTDYRAAFKTARDAGLKQRHERRVAGRSQCHMCNDQGERCTAEVADPLAEVLLCPRHTGLVLEYALHVQARITAATTQTTPAGGADRGDQKEIIA